jgi:hypothetical protein
MYHDHEVSMENCHLNEKWCFYESNTERLSASIGSYIRHVHWLLKEVVSLMVI